MDILTEYETDFVGWTERQAAILRALPPGTHGLDTAELAEEVEDLGRAEIRAASSLLQQTLIHLIKRASEPESLATEHWTGEILTFQADAIFASTAGIRQRIDLDLVWRLACRKALAQRSKHIQPSVLPRTCPLTLDELLAEDFDVEISVRKMRAAIEPGPS